MVQQIDNHLVKAIVDLAIFLEFSPDSILNEDAAVEAMEQMASELSLMSDQSKAVFVSLTQELAAKYGGKEKFVRDLPESLGLL